MCDTSDLYVVRICDRVNGASSGAARRSWWMPSLAASRRTAAAPAAWSMRAPHGYVLYAEVCIPQCSAWLLDFEPRTADDEAVMESRSHAKSAIGLPAWFIARGFDTSRSIFKRSSSFRTIHSRHSFWWVKGKPAKCKYLEYSPLSRLFELISHMIVIANINSEIDPIIGQP